MRRKRKTNWRRIWSIVIIWTVIGLCQSFYEFLVFNVYDFEHPQGLQIWPLFLTSILGGFVAGILGGYVLVTYTVPLFSKYPFGKVLAIIFVLYTLVFSVVVLTIVPVAAYFLNPDPSVNPYRALLRLNIFKSDLFRQYLFWGTVNIFTMIGVFVSDKYGPGVFVDFLKGKYFHPEKETRIFMFLDVRGSTSIAERLGEKKYFNFLKSFIDDATDPILDNKGEIYQYIGDEIVISWPLEKGLKHNNCINCFFAVQDQFLKLKEEYLGLYNTWPELKAGVHVGEVMVGEMGRVKRDITYSGDVLNTASRIQGTCNKNGVDLMISDQLYKQIIAPKEYMAVHHEDILLRGKKQKMGLVSLKKA